MNLPVAAQEALAQFSAPMSWEQRTRLLMQWGSKLSPLTDGERIPEHQVQGCESRVWLVVDQTEPYCCFRVDSDARLLRGLLALLLGRLNGLTRSEIEAVDWIDWFTQLGLSKQLSSSRTNGLNAVLKAILGFF